MDQTKDFLTPAKKTVTSTGPGGLMVCKCAPESSTNSGSREAGDQTCDPCDYCLTC